MFEKRYLKMNSVLTFEYKDIEDYAIRVAAGEYPNKLPKTTTFDLLKKELKANLEKLSDGRILVYDFYAVGENDFLVLSRLGISVLTREELAAVTLD